MGAGLVENPLRVRIRIERNRFISDAFLQERVEEVRTPETISFGLLL